MTAPRATALDVTKALYHHFAGRWAFVTEVEAADATGRRLARRIDVLLLRRKGNDVERLAIEVKVTRGDFLADVRCPEKQAPWRALSHRHAYAVPAGLVRVDEVPAASGLLTVDRLGTDYPLVEFARRAVRPAGHEPGPLPLQIQMDAWWRASRAEARAKGIAWADGHDQADEEELRARLLRAEHELKLAANRADREREQRLVWQRRYAAHEPPACGTCALPLHPARGRNARFNGDQWEHRDELQGAACEQTRRAVAEATDAEREASSRLGRYIHVPGPEPVELELVAG